MGQAGAGPGRNRGEAAPGWGKGGRGRGEGGPGQPGARPCCAPLTKPESVTCNFLSTT
jgi:hypothetical protein